MNICPACNSEVFFCCIHHIGEYTVEYYSDGAGIKYTNVYAPFEAPYKSLSLNGFVPTERIEKLLLLK